MQASELLPLTCFSLTRIIAGPSIRCSGFSPGRPIWTRRFKQFADLVHPNWYASLDFWLAVVGIVVSGVGAFLSYRAFVEAGKAELAAKEAAKAVKRQSDIASLAEVISDLTGLKSRIKFADARGGSHRFAGG